MSLTLASRIKVLALLALTVAPSAVEAQYGYPYGYRRRTGWRNVYLAAILIPIAFFILLWVMWMLIFRAIYRRRRQGAATAVLPTSSTTTGSGYYPSADGYNNSSAYGNSAYDNNGGTASSYYNNNGPEMTQAYTAPPQQAYRPGGQETYAPPAGVPPTGYDSYGGGYQPPAGAPPVGYTR